MWVPLEYDTPFGKLRKIHFRKRPDVGWMWQCPVCKTWSALVDAQVEGRVSIDCAADGNCTFCERYDFRPVLRAAGAEI